NYPSLFIYLTHILHLILTGFGVFQLNASDPSLVWQWPYQIMLSARFLSALFGAGTAILLYFLINAWNPSYKKYALAASLLFALLPGHAQHSHFATVDVASTFWIALSLFLALRSAKVNNPTKLLLT